MYMPMEFILNKKKVCLFDFLKKSVLKLLDLIVYITQLFIAEHN